MSGIAGQLRSDLAKKMVLLSGPRQCGKTTLVQEIISERHGVYLSWDDPGDRRQTQNLAFDLDARLWTFDELHKFRRWRGFLKALYDRYRGQHQILVTGSARLELYGHGGDSLQGRYFAYHFHPLTAAEIARRSFPGLDGLPDLANDPVGTDLLDSLLVLGGFPEPFLSGSAKEAARWRLGYADRLVHEDVRELERVRELDRMELLHDRLAAITPDGTSLYVTLKLSQAVGVVDTVTNSVATFIRVPAYPNRIAISPDGRTAYVAHSRPRQFGTLSVIDTETESVIAIVGLDQPSNELAVTPDGKFIYLTNGPAGTITVLETKTYQIVTIIPVGGNTEKIALATMPNGCMPVRACAGDCNLDRAVTVDEVLLGVNIALDNAFATACRAADADGDQEVSINELVSAVRFATEGCAGEPANPPVSQFAF